MRMNDRKERPFLLGVIEGILSGKVNIGTVEKAPNFLSY